MKDKLQTSWKSVLGELEVVLSQANFQTWLKGTNLIEVSNNVATIYVPNIFTKQWVKEKYHVQILDALKKVDPSIVNAEYTTKKSNSTPTNTPLSKDVEI